MFICSSLHNPIIKAFPDGVFFQHCFPRVSWSPAFPWPSDVPFANPAGPPFGGQRCNVGCKFPDGFYACNRQRFQASVVRQHVYFVVLHPCKMSCHGNAELVLDGGPTTTRINRRYSTSNFAKSFLRMARCDAPKHASQVKSKLAGPKGGSALRAQTQTKKN